MRVTRTSSISGITRTFDLPITEEQVIRYNNGSEPIQGVFSNLSAPEREFIITGVTKEEWDCIFGTKKIRL